MSVILIDNLKWLVLPGELVLLIWYLLHWDNVHLLRVVLWLIHYKLLYWSILSHRVESRVIHLHMHSWHVHLHSAYLLRCLLVLMF